MFISTIEIKNFKLFGPSSWFEVKDVNVPDGAADGSGLNVFVGENGGGKTALLEAISLPLLDYKSEGLVVQDFNDTGEKIEVRLFSSEDFEVAKTMPRQQFTANGFSFEAGVRSRESRAYLSSIVVSDTKFLSTNPDNPRPNSPDLRLSVNNPFSGKRFDANDVLYLDKNRLFQIKSGNFNTTRFDRLMENFSYQYIKNSEEIVDLNDSLNNQVKDGKTENRFLETAISKFRELTDLEIGLDLIDNYQPFLGAFFSQKKANNLQIRLDDMGSGYEMIFSLLYSACLAQQSGKELIVLIDEPELHLHPLLQEKFVDFLLEFSKEAQVFLTTHSPLLIKQLSYSDEVSVRIIQNGQEVVGLGERVLPYISANETNYLAFSLATEEYHNELFEELKYLHGVSMSIQDFDASFFIATKGENQDSPWRGNPNQVSRHTFIRNQIHHRQENGVASYHDLAESIATMRGFF